MSTQGPQARSRHSLSLLILVILLAAVMAASCQQEPAEPAATIIKEDQPLLNTVEAGSPTADTSGQIPTRAVVRTEPAATSTPESTAEPSPTAGRVAETSEAAGVAETIESAAPRDYPEGALIAVKMDGQVGILLDEIPQDMRDRLAESLIDRGEDAWLALARRQIRLTSRRLNFRNFVYSNKGQLPLPPEDLWDIELDSNGPRRQSIDDHDLVTTAYVFTSTLLTDAASPEKAEPALGEIGGRWNEPFILPADPDQLLQRTGNACINEAGFPPNSFDSENAWVFYDHACEASSAGPLGCHRSRLADQSCLRALEENVGTVETVVSFQRLEWNSDTAAEVRIGEVSSEDKPDLDVIGPELSNNRIIYRYFPSDSCAIEEACVNSSGWRRLLQFDAVVHNIGGGALHIGPVVAADPTHNLFQYNACHDHFHFSDYGDFFLSNEEGEFSSKQAFCVESTDRRSNNEFSPLTHDYHCRFQGIQSGWVDEYHAGLDCQWIDITEVETSSENSSVTLGFLSNPDQFLCEGTPVLDDDGFQLWEPSGLMTEDGRSIERPQCEFIPNWDRNNLASQEIAFNSAGTFVTAPCDTPNNSGHLGPYRNCGFSQQLDGVELFSSAESGSESGGREESQRAGGFSCDPGQSVKMTCTLEQGEDPQAVRLCDFSDQLGVGLGCTFQEALGSMIVDSDETETTFLCPFPRDENEPGGGFSLFSAPLYDGDESAAVSCTIDS